MKLMQRLKSMLFPRSTLSRTQGWGVGFLPGSLDDAIHRVGDPWTNSVVAAAISWIAWNINQGRLRILRQGQEVDRSIPTLDPPNPYMPLGTLLTPTVLSLAVSGNAYWLPDMNPAGQAIAWYWVPHWLVHPFRNDPYEFISGYQYDSGEKQLIFEPDQVCHFRLGVDPRNPMRGLSPLASVISEIASDNEGSRFSLAIMKNYGVMSGLLTPEDGPISIDDAERIRRELNERFAGEGRGSILVGTGKMKFTPVAQRPNDLAIDTLRDIPEERICSAIGVPAMLLHLGSGAQHATYSNLEVARRSAWESTILPYQNLIAETLTRILRVHKHLAPDEVLDFDNSKVNALRENADSLWKRVTEAWRAGLISRRLAFDLLELQADAPIPDEYFMPASLAAPAAARMANYRRLLEEHFERDAPIGLSNGL